MKSPRPPIMGESEAEPHPSPLLPKGEGAGSSLPGCFSPGSGVPSPFGRRGWARSDRVRFLPTPPLLGAGGFFFFLAVSGCAPHSASAPGTAASAAPAAAADTLAPGVLHRAIPTRAGAGIDLVDISLAVSSCRLTVQTQGVTRFQGHVVGQAYTPHDWLTRTHGLMAVNGGYFGQEDAAGRKEVVGLLVQRGRVRHAAPPLTGSGSATIHKGQYVRSAFGLLPGGLPSIVWAATAPGNPQAVTAYAGPMGRPVAAWRAADAVGCGPTLISGGKMVVTQYGERLVSPGPEARTFVAYDGPAGHPKHLVVGIASGADFSELAAFLARYFPRYDHTHAEAAMCLDGGASTQMTYVVGGTALSPRETGMTVPDALVLLPR